MSYSVNDLRNILSLTQTAFGEKYGIPMRTIQNWENGVSKCPDYVLGLLTRCVLEDYEEENGKVAKYYIECTDTEEIFDLHLGEANDLEEAIRIGKEFRERGYNVEVVKGFDFLSGNYDPIQF